MTLLVPFDGSPLSVAALERAGVLGEALDVPVRAVTVVPVRNARYARERGWLAPEEAFDLDLVTGRVEAAVAALVADAAVQVERVDRYAPSGTIARRIRDVARDHGATMVVVGSDNAGRMVTALGSVGGAVATDARYDVLIVRRERPVPAPVDNAPAVDEADDGGHGDAAPTGDGDT